MERIEVNAMTGEQRTIPLTKEEVAETKARAQAEPPAPLTPAQKLAQSGLTVAELKGLLGLAP